MGKKWQPCQISFSWGPKLPRMVTVATKLKDSFSWKKLYEKPRQCVKKQRYHVANKGPSSQGYGFSSGHVWMWFGSKRKWAPKNWCFWTVVLRKSLESPLDCRELKPVTPKGHQPEYALKGLMLKLKLWYFGLLLRRNRPFENDPDAVEDWGQEEKGATEDEMVAWHHWLNGHEFEQTWETVKYGDTWHATVHGVTNSRI